MHEILQNLWRWNAKLKTSKDKKLNSHFSHRLPLDKPSNLSTFASICSQLHICESFPPEFQLKNKLAYVEQSMKFHRTKF